MRWYHVRERMRFAAIFFLTVSAVSAAVRLPAIISDGMVLQRDKPGRIWGWAEPAEAVTVQFRGQSISTQADELGRWSVFIAPSAAGGPFDLIVRGANQVKIANVLVGEVWIASGQSNMVWSVQQSRDAASEIAAANFPKIRFFQVENTVSQVPLLDLRGVWQETSPATAGRFSGVGYFFARHLHQMLNVPIAIIQTAWGGTPAESWISGPSLASDPALISVYADWARITEAYPAASLRYQMDLNKWERSYEGRKPAPAPGPNHPHMPSGLYNAMIEPLTPYAIRGAIWYQGETNAGKSRAWVYRRLFPALIEDWRRAWGQGDFPFLFVQLANFTAPDAQYPELREAQAMTLSLRNTGMAVTIDIGESKDIHPKNKQGVGDRLALAARSIAYGESNLVYSGPMFQEAVPEGDSLRVYFSSTGSGLEAKGGVLKGFAIAGADRKFVSAQARIDGGTVLVSSPSVAKPAYVRYAWADDPEVSLYNKEGLPASPFRSDDWSQPRRFR